MNDVLKRAWHTWWQTFGAAVIVVFAASAADIGQITDIDSAKKVGLSLCAAILAAALSAVKTTLAQLFETSAISDEEDPDPDVPPAVAPPAHGHEVAPANMHADSAGPQG